MSPEHWSRIKDLLEAALRLEVPQRKDYLDRVCEQDSALRDEIESLVEAYEADGDLLERAPPQAQAHDRMLGLRLGPYQIVEHVGAGGMGTVYRAVRADEVFNREVAIKVVRQGLDVACLTRQFRRERQIMASLQHPNIATLIDGGSTPEGLPYFVMEFIRGKPIDVYCAEKGLGARERLGLFLTVCGAVEFAHGHGVVHRDIKPGNILITNSGIPKLLDFGIAKILDPDAFPGTRDTATTMVRALTPEYASPEQIAGRPVSATSDVYSLGVLLCELLGGGRPCRPDPDGSIGRVAAAPSSGLSNRQELARDLESIVLMAIRREPDARYHSAGALAEDVGRYLEGLPVAARKHTLPYRISKFVRRQKTAVLSSAVAIILAVAASMLLAMWNRRDEAGVQPQTTPFTSMPGKEFQPNFSPDGAKIAYAAIGERRRNSGIFVQGIGGGPAFRLTTDLTNDVNPVWSPDGSRIAWLRTGPGETAIMISPGSGDAQARVAGLYPNGSEELGRHLDWSTDGRWFSASDKEAAAAPFHIVLVDAGSGRKRQVSLPPANIIGDRSPAFSPDGKNLAYVRVTFSGVNDVYVSAVNGGGGRRITFDNRDVTGVTWTRDGRSLVFASSRRGNLALWRVPASGGQPVRVPAVGDRATDPAFSRDGRKIVYAQYFEDVNIWRIDTAGRGPALKLISSTQLDTSPQYSPDGAQIAFRSDRSGSNEIWVSDSEGRNAVQLTHFGGPLAGTPRWSPDGREIAFDARPEGPPRIFVTGLSGPARQVTNGPAEDVVPSWSSDGRYVYFGSNRSGMWQIWRVPAGGGAGEQVTSQGGFAAFESPDGKYLYYAKYRAGPGLWRKSLPRGPEELVLDRLQPGFWGYWAVVGTGIYFGDHAGFGGAAGLYFYDLAQKQVRLVATVDKPLRVADSAFAASPDGRFLLFSEVDESGSDILVLDHYR